MNDEAVQWIEEGYKTWKLTDVDAKGTPVRYRPRGEVIVRPIFQLIEDVTPSYEFLNACPTCVHGKRHECYTCSAPIPHMSYGRCPTCFLESW